MNFELAFSALTGNEPFPWQRALYEQFARGLPSVRRCAIPTGLGKTSVIPIWLIALAANPAAVPRRLVYVVNRRTVVDQATDEALTLRNKLASVEADGATELRERLNRLCVNSETVPLAISTLRGQFADNREWSADPSRPAVILGTVDMIGSRLLFSGYGVGFRLKPLHAGFLGQDVLLVHDEAHLEPAFQALLDAICDEQARCDEFRPFRVIELSATTRNREQPAGPSEPDRVDGTFGLTDLDFRVPEIRKRVYAKKALHLHEIEDEKELPDRLSELALKHESANRTVLVFARTVEAVEKVAASLRKVSSLVETLTGTLRGKERDALIDRPVFRRFLPKPEPGEKTAYLVCTSAGEVGVNISATDLVCDLSTFESTAQRLGRVNRFGNAQDTRIDVVHPRTIDDKEDYRLRLKRTLELLRALNGDGSPAALDRLDANARVAAFSPEPKVPPVSDILFDTWALTSIKTELPGRPPVEPYLHGITEHDEPETHVAWRAEVGWVTGLLCERYEPADLLANYPIKPHEVLRDRSTRVFDRLVSLAKASPESPVWLVSKDGTVETLSLNDLANKDRRDRIHFCTVLLPPEAGGLRAGALTGNPDDSADDVADDWLDAAKQNRRRRVWDLNDAPEGMRLVVSVDLRPDAEDEPSDGGEQEPTKRYWNWFVRPYSADDDGSRTSRGAVSWCVHTDDVVKNAERIVAALPLPDDVKKALVVAARHHDLGKKRIVWQRAIGNREPANWLAKSGKHFGFGQMKPIELTDYRHEFGSLVDVQSQSDFQRLDDDSKALVLHLIAAHHGLGRPHFPSELAFDPEAPVDTVLIAAEVPRRFARLQRRYGRWGLAYLESLLRAADYAASAAPSATLEVRP